MQTFFSFGILNGKSSNNTFFKVIICSYQYGNDKICNINKSLWNIKTWHTYHRKKQLMTYSCAGASRLQLTKVFPVIDVCRCGLRCDVTPYNKSCDLSETGFIFKRNGLITSSSICVYKHSSETVRLWHSSICRPCALWGLRVSLDMRIRVCVRNGCATETKRKNDKKSGSISKSP